MKKVWVHLGRLGDIMAILPMLWKDNQDGKRWSLMVAAEYESILDGVSYVDPLVYNGPHYEIGKACQEAEAFGEVFCSQVNGPMDQVLEHVYKPAGQESARTTSFEKEMWKIAGRLKEWDECYPLLFDKRSYDAEKKILEENGFLRRGKQKRLMLVSTKGNSSPFPHTELLMELLKGRFGKTHRILELPKAERIFDLLCLYERAECLVTTDSAPLHLAYACPKLPVIAFANDKPLLWNGSPWRPNHIFYCRYSDFVERAVEMLNTIEHKDHHDLKDVVRVFNAYDNKPDRPYGVTSWSVLPIRKGMCGRDSSFEKDSKRIPYLKDCIRMAMQLPESEFVCVTHPSLHFTDQEVVRKHDSCFAYRLLESNNDTTFQPTVDLFCARKSWWKSHLHEIPDYFLGRDYWWTHGLRGLFSKHGAVDVTGIVRKLPTQLKEPPAKPPYPPRIKINKELAEKYIAEAGIYSRYPKVSEQIEVAASFSGMLRNGYNPTIIEHGGKIVMALRYHPVDSPATSLMLVELKPDLTIESSRPIEISGGSVEDPKFFKHQGELCMSWVDANWPSPPPLKGTVNYAVYRHETFQDFKRPEVPGNDGTSMQKNYVLFEHDGVLHCITNCQPYEIYRLDDYRLISSPSLKWPYGAIRGGTVPVPYEGKWLRFFHGHLDNEFGLWNRRYYVGAILMNPEPPFEVLRVSTKPIIYGSEIDQLKVKDRPRHWKANVVFPSGVVERDGGWLVSLGVNDSASLIVKVHPKELNFL